MEVILLVVVAVIFAALYVERFISTKGIHNSYKELQRKNIELEIKLSLTEGIVDNKRKKIVELYSRIEKLETDNRLVSNRLKVYQDKLQNIGKFLDK